MISALAALFMNILSFFHSSMFWFSTLPFSLRQLEYKIYGSGSAICVVTLVIPLAAP
jgi:hypothetical protein